MCGNSSVPNRQSKQKAGKPLGPRQTSNEHHNSRAFGLCGRLACIRNRQKTNSGEVQAEKSETRQAEKAEGLHRSAGGTYGIHCWKGEVTTVGGGKGCIQRERANRACALGVRATRHATRFVVSNLSLGRAGRRRGSVGKGELHVAIAGAKINRLFVLGGRAGGKRPRSGDRGKETVRRPKQQTNKHGTLRDERKKCTSAPDIRESIEEEKAVLCAGNACTFVGGPNKLDQTRQAWRSDLGFPDPF